MFYGYTEFSVCTMQLLNPTVVKAAERRNQMHKRLIVAVCDRHADNEPLWLL